VLGLSLPAGPEAPEAALTVASARIDYDGKLRVVTSDGSAWRSQDVGVALPKPGQAIVVKAAVMGGYECRLGKWDSFLCTRADER
jgi:hypothetical protein